MIEGGYTGTPTGLHTDRVAHPTVAAYTPVPGAMRARQCALAGGLIGGAPLKSLQDSVMKCAAVIIRT